MFGISDLIYRHFNRRIDILHNHVSSLKRKSDMNHEETIARLTTMAATVTQIGSSVVGLMSEKAALEAENLALKEQLAAAMQTTPDEDAGFSDVEGALAVIAAMVPAAPVAEVPPEPVDLEPDASIEPV